MPEAAQQSAPAVPVVALREVTKRYPGVTANDAVSLEIRPGEVHALLGENGAGKSTVVAMLSGLQTPDSGTILVDGTPEAVSSPARALRLGIGAVFQHAMLVPSLTVAENVTLGGAWWQRPPRGDTAARIAEVCAGLGIALDPSARVGSLSLGQQQQVEIVRALMRGSRVLILDEATAMLTPKGAEELGGLMRRLVAGGMAILFITHKLNEALAYGDRITVLRLGRKVGEIEPARLTALGTAQATDEVIRLMFGANTRDGTGGGRPRYISAGGPPVLEIAGLAVADAAVPVADVDLRVAAGEIVGIAGIDGNGQKQLAEAVSGQRPLAAGEVLLAGKPIGALSVGARRRAGLRYVTDDRLGEGTVSTFPVSLNLLLKDIGRAPYWQNGIERNDAIGAFARRLIADFDIRTPGPETQIGKLSGGNIQKALLARELTGETRAVVFAKPTYGLDVQNIRASRDRIAKAADSGMAVVLISTDLEEILELSDRIAVMAKGRLIGIVPNGEDARSHVGELMSGVAA